MTSIDKQIAAVVAGWIRHSIEIAHRMLLLWVLLGALGIVVVPPVWLLVCLLISVTFVVALGLFGMILRAAGGKVRWPE